MRASTADSSNVALKKFSFRQLGLAAAASLSLCE
jgi:hypothetical protein